MLLPFADDPKTQKKVSTVMRAIQLKANRLFGHKLFKREKQSKEVLFVFDKMIERTDIPEWKRRYYKAMRKDFDKDEMVLDEAVAEKQDKFIQSEINLAIKKGLLPKPKYVQTIQTN